MQTDPTPTQPDARRSTSIAPARRWARRLAYFTILAIAACVMQAPDSDEGEGGGGSAEYLDTPPPTPPIIPTSCENTHWAPR